jgi:hypothetical protein
MGILSWEGDTSVTNYPAQPTYGQGLREAYDAQVALLTGKKVGEADFRSVGKLEDLVRDYEGPLRKQTAQVDTDVMRQTLLGSKETTDSEGRLVTGSERTGVISSEAERAEELRDFWGQALEDFSRRLEPESKGNTIGTKNFLKKAEAIGLTAADVDEVSIKMDEVANARHGGSGGAVQTDYTMDSGDIAAVIVPFENEVSRYSAEIEAATSPTYELDSTGSPKIYTDPDGSVIRNRAVSTTTGMVDLIGDSRAIKSAVKQDDYESYVRDDEDNMSGFQAENERRAGAGEAPVTMEQWGKERYETVGRSAGDKMPTKYGYAEEDPGRRAGFDPSGEFLGLSAFGEDIQAQNLSRQRQRDLEDVARLSPLYSDIMDKYKPGTQEALEDARGVLKAREGALTGAGGSLSDASTQVRESFLRILGREPDAAGLAHWTDALQRGASVGDMDLAFAEARASGDAGPVMEGRLQAQARALGRAAAGGLDTGEAITAPGGNAATGYGAAKLTTPGKLTADTEYTAGVAKAIDPLSAATGYAPSATTKARDLSAATSYTADTGVAAGRIGEGYEPTKTISTETRTPLDIENRGLMDESLRSYREGGLSTPEYYDEKEYYDALSGTFGIDAPYEDYKRGYTSEMTDREGRGTSDIRTRLMEDAYTGLGEGLTVREKENIEQASRRRATALGRAFDRGSIADEVQSRVLEDRNRQAQNRAYAQQVLGQEAGLQTSDMGRSLQAQLANQQAANQAASMGMQAGIGQEQAGAAQDLQAQLANQQAINRQREFGVGAGLQREQVGAQFAQQKSLADQQAANQAAQYGIGAGLQQESLGAQMAQQKAVADAQAANQAAQFGVGAGLQQQQFGAGQDIAAQALNREAIMKGSEFDILQSVARGEQNIGRELAAAESDLDRDYRQRVSQEQLAQQGTLGYIDAATRLAALEDTRTLDPIAGILGQTRGGSIGTGNQLFGTAQYGLQSGPQYLNPESGLGFIQNQATNAANMFGAQSMADATVRGSKIAAGGNILSSLVPTWKICWVAREVYGSHNPAWLDFRQWMFSSAPRWFFKLYLAFGERFANFISNKPRLKARIRMWMDSKIGR